MDIRPVPSVQAITLAKLIRLLAMTGKKAFQKYLFDPISYAGWEGPKQSWSSKKYMEKIRSGMMEISRLNSIGPLCKKMICQAMTENPSSLGDSCLLFLEVIANEPIVASSQESIDFVKMIDKTLSRFSDLHSNRSERLFAETVSSFSPDELKEAFKPIKLDTNKDKVYLDTEVHNLYQQVLSASKSGNLQRCKKLLSGYIIKYRDTDSYSEEEVLKLINALNLRERGFAEELNNAMAIDLYYQLTKAILEKNIKKSIASIRKYAHIFEGDPQTPYFLEIDKMERTLYKIITEKGLMSELKRAL
jgi:hypothetical protein